MEMFSKHEEFWSKRLGTFKAIHHGINWKERARPVDQHSYRTGQKSQEVFCERLGKQVKAGEVLPAQSKWPSFIVLVSKMDENRQFCVLLSPDRRRYTRHLFYPLLRIDNFINSLKEAQVFPALHALWADFVELIKDENLNKTILISPLGMSYYNLNAVWGTKRACNFPKRIRNHLIWRSTETESRLIWWHDYLLYKKPSTLWEHNWSDESALSG